ncbi:neural cell adhesion molecule 1-like [Mytilus galloprovincialis]|uniref:neural cell adhesion molecule 1-like n=1 Tax=Mytilus galloprovincialis TaxID=29158 RepID=UPI003F7C7C7E
MIKISDPSHRHRRQRYSRVIAYGMDLIIIIVLLGSSTKCLVNGNGMFTIDLKVMNSTCDGKSCDGYEFKICYAQNGETLHSKCLELYDTLSINYEPAFYQRFDTELKPLYGIDLTALPYTFILYFNDEALYDSNIRPQNGTTMVLTFQSDRSFIQISLTSECFDVRHCTGFLCNKCFTEPPIVTVPDSKTGSIGGNLTIPCNVSELNSDTVIRWFKNDGSFSTPINIRERERFFGGTNKSPDLIIISVQKEDEGNYICQAINLEFEGSSQPVYLSILEYPVVNVPNIEPAIEGTNITIPCYVSPTSEVTRITWYKNNSILYIYGNDRFSGGTISAPSLKIYFVEENDEGNYTCQAMNPVGFGKSVPTFLQVLPDKPKVHLQRIEPVVI